MINPSQFDFNASKLPKQKSFAVPMIFILIGVAAFGYAYYLHQANATQLIEKEAQQPKPESK